MKQNLFTKILSTYLLLVVFYLPGCDKNREGILSITTLEPYVITPNTYVELKEFLSLQDYHWDTIKEGAPPFILERFPQNLAEISNISEKKKLFFLALLPMVLIENQKILQQRENLRDLFKLYDTGIELNKKQLSTIYSIAQEYQIDKDPLIDKSERQKLLRRVDIIPSSMVIAQAANESAYGTSRFALKANNMFGEWTFEPGTGMVPQNRPPGEIYEVRRFSTLYDSVKSYMKNINTHRAYKSLRVQRANMRAQGQPLNGTELAKGLTLYSARGEDYVKEIQKMINNNNLKKLSNTELRKYIKLPQMTIAKSRAGLLSSQMLISRPTSKGVNP